MNDFYGAGWALNEGNKMCALENVGGFLGGSDGKESACSAGDLGSISGQENRWRRKWQPTPAFLPGEFHGQRSLADYSPWGHKQSDTAEQLTVSENVTENA